MRRANAMGQDDSARMGAPTAPMAWRKSTASRSYPPADSFIDIDGETDLTPSSGPSAPTLDHRTIVISNLSDRVTYNDIVSILRGGRIVDIFMRNDRTAMVTFAEGAVEFMAYVKRQDVYLHQKRLEFRWNDRPYNVPQHILDKIERVGATRNIVIRGAESKLITPTQIRDDLDHIHNLVVIDVKMVNGDAYVSTNSIQNVQFARTCLLSRTAYKGLRIQWYADECAQPLPPLPRRTRTPSGQAPAKPSPPVNRYSVLESDLLDDGFGEDDEDWL
ncbi:hypothetical protein M011DRAFT_469901 [Sporormia fimetaria CBS 119925]|uniref:RRM domain-containing protein n=1 Tax=Sporormia fimetaria CBS 119925 TaxID=1340428 RepID=A0A6A6V7P9_9PLEO|nr:hypothetical protein M011DRAFT_469901 [Sporormia fimetaria CBS 119925]